MTVMDMVGMRPTHEWRAADKKADWIIMVMTRIIMVMIVMAIVMIVMATGMIVMDMVDTYSSCDPPMSGGLQMRRLTVQTVMIIK